MARDSLKPINDASDEQQPTSRLSDFVDNVFLPWVKDHKRPSTYKGYEDMWEGHLWAHCGDWWLRDARTADIQRLLDQIAKEDGLSKTTLKHIKHLLSGIYRFAMQQGLFERANPVTAASIPDAPGPSGGEIRGMRWKIWRVANLSRSIESHNQSGNRSSQNPRP